MKILVETTGQFLLVDYAEGSQVVEAHRPSVVVRSNFVNQRATLNQIKFIGELTDEATDEEFEKYVTDSDGDITLAVEAFLGAYGTEQASKKRAPKKE